MTLWKDPKWYGAEERIVPAGEAPKEAPEGMASEEGAAGTLVEIGEDGEGQSREERDN